MPSLFSKPLAVASALVAFFGTANSVPVVTGNLTELPWVPCGNSMWCTDVYFCAGPWANLTTAPMPPTATSGFAYAYRSNLTSDCIPGASPIMRVQPGNVYKVTFHNTADMDPRFIDPNSALFANMQTAWDATMAPAAGFQQWGGMDQPLHTTNVHIHGGHLSGMGDHDNVLRPVFPGACQTYTYHVGADTPGGFHWYHPHSHGRVAYQVIGGAFGLFIIDDYNSALTSNGIGVDINGKAVDQPVKNFLTFKDLERNLMAYTEFGTRMGNGDPLGAKMSITANQWTRWRILHAKPEGVLGWTVFKDPAGLVLAWNTTTGPRCEVYELANDGVYLSRVPYKAYAKNGVNSTYEYNIHGAQRLDLAIRCTTVGNFTIEYDGGAVARVNVLATPKTNPYPQSVASPFSAGGKLQWIPTRPYFLRETRKGYPGFPAEVKTIAAPFVVRLGFDGINGLLFDNAPTTPMVSMQFNSSIVYEFEFWNTGPHPTHMHQQHFQIVTPGGCGGLKEGEWYDTITHIGAGICNVRTRWINFTGPVVMHCHVLDHEDMGIMTWIDIPFKAPGSFEASPLFTSNTKPGYCCVPRVDKVTKKQICTGVPQCGGTVGINTCNQPCSVAVSLCPANKPYCSTTGVCFATVRSADGVPIPDGASGSCDQPILPWVLMGVGLAVAAIAVVFAVCVVRQRGANYSTILIEEMKQESVHMPSRNFSPFPGQSPAAPQMSI